VTLQPIIFASSGCPVVVTSENPQYIIHDGARLKLKLGDVLYLSEELLDGL